MPLLKNNAFVDDDYASLADDEALPIGRNVLVGFARAQADWDALAKHPALIGVRVANDDKLTALTPYLSKIALLVLAFPAFNDGRSYSLARGLRLDGYQGELRAEGNILPDQLQFMKQVGFDSFVVSERFALPIWQAAAQQMSLAYQRGLVRAAAETEVWSKRHHGSASWENRPHVD